MSHTAHKFGNCSVNVSGFTFDFPHFYLRNFIMSSNGYSLLQALLFPCHCQQGRIDRNFDFIDHDCVSIITLHGQSDFRRPVCLNRSLLDES